LFTGEFEHEHKIAFLFFFGSLSLRVFASTRAWRVPCPRKCSPPLSDFDPMEPPPNKARLRDLRSFPFLATFLTVFVSSLYGVHLEIFIRLSVTFCVFSIPYFSTQGSCDNLPFDGFYALHRVLRHPFFPRGFLLFGSHCIWLGLAAFGFPGLDLFSTFFFVPPFSPARLI